MNQAIAADGEGIEFLKEKTYLNSFKDDKAILLNKVTEKFIAEIANHRNWSRKKEVMSISV